MWREARGFLAQLFPSYKNEIENIDIVITPTLRDRTYPFYVSKVDYDRNIIILSPSVYYLERKTRESLPSLSGLWEILEKYLFPIFNFHISQSKYREYIPKFHRLVPLHEAAHLIDGIGKKREYIEELYLKNVYVEWNRRGNIIEVFLRYPEETLNSWDLSFWAHFLIPIRNSLVFLPFRVYISNKLEEFSIKNAGAEYFAIGVETLFVEEKWKAKKDKYLQGVCINSFLEILLSTVYITDEIKMDTFLQVGDSVSDILAYSLPSFISSLYLLQNQFNLSDREKKFEERIPKRFFRENSQKLFEVLQKMIEEKPSQILNFFLAAKI